MGTERCYVHTVHRDQAALLPLIKTVFILYSIAHKQCRLTRFPERSQYGKGLLSDPHMQLRKQSKSRLCARTLFDWGAMGGLTTLSNNFIFHTTRLGNAFFSKEHNVLAFFIKECGVLCVLYKRTRRSLRSL